MAATPIRGIRVPDDEWADWQERAEAAGVSVTELVRVRMNGRPPIVAVHPTTLEPIEPLTEIDPASFITAPSTEVVQSGEPARPLPDPEPGLDPSTLGATAACRHPKKFRDVKPYVTMCSTELGGCGARL